MPPSEQEAIRAVSVLATQLGNQISVLMLNYISTAKDLPSGFRELSHTFLDTCRTLWAIETGVSELAAANRALPEVIINEVEKKFAAAYADFQSLAKLIGKLNHYEHRGAWGKLQRGLHRPTQELSRIHDSLQKTNEALQISGMAFHWSLSLGDARPDESLRGGYASLAAALGRIGKGRSATAVDKASTVEPARSQASEGSLRSSSPSLPPKDSPASHRKQGHQPSIQPKLPPQEETEIEPEPVADDTSSILSLNGFLVSQPDREPARSSSLPNRGPPATRMGPTTASFADVYSRHNSEGPAQPSRLARPHHDAANPRNLSEAVGRRDVESIRALLAHGADANQQTSNATTLLIQAVRARTPQAILEMLLRAGADANRKDNCGTTALCEAVQSNQPDTVTTLLDHGANPNLPGPEHALWPAVYRPDCLRILLARGADINKAPGLMEQATSVNSIDAVRVLLQAGIDPNCKKDGIYTPLCSAIRDDRPYIVSLLLSHRADPNLMASEYPAWKCITQNRLHFLPDLLAAGADLHHPPGIAECAVAQNNLSALTWLIQTGCVNPNDRTSNGHTALTTALRDNRLDMLEFLLAHGADPNLRGQDWPIYMATKSPALLKLLLPKTTNLAAHKGVLERAVHANQLESVKLLLAAGASAEWKNGGVFSPLTTALRERHHQIVHFLLEADGDDGGCRADPNAPGEHLPLVKAIRRCDDGDFSMIELLLSKGADPNKCYRGWNAIMQAVEDRDLGLLSLLTEKGGPVDFDVKDETGRTVLDMVEADGWTEGREILVRAGRC
ncbi:ankyrin repeat-containing domain protein [Aspergillus aurantiobrunneus]